MKKNNPLPKNKILIIDDIVMHAETFSRIVQEYCNCEVEICTEPENLFDDFTFEKFDLILLDLNIANISGKDILLKIRTQFSQVQLPVIFLMANASAQTIVELMELGANDVLIKGSPYIIIKSRINYALQFKNHEVKINKIIKYKMQFLANIVHEIRTPLTAIMGVTTLLEETELSSEQSKYIEIYKKSSNSLYKIVNDVLDYSKITADKYSVEVIEFEINSMLNDLINLASPIAKEKKLELKCLDESTKNIMACGDPFRIQQILLNLITNAIKFTPSGTISITSTINKSNEILQFAVTDTGIGMTSEVCKKIFQDYEQADESTQNKFGGTGLGLSISKKLAIVMKGNISVSSIPGTGTTFTLSLPLIKPTTKSHPPQIEVPTQNNNINILLIDDQPEHLELVKENLSAANRIIATTSSPIAALELTTKYKYDIIISDITMPIMDGVELTKTLRKFQFKGHIIGLSSSTSIEFKDAMKQSGAIQVFDKLTELDDLNNTITKLSQNLSTNNYLSHSNTNKKAILLVIDDNADNLLLIQKFLEKLPLEIYTATGGVEGIEKYERLKPNIVLLDIHMSDMHGREVLKKIRDIEKTNKLPVSYLVSFSADGSQAQIEEFLKWGFNQNISKPIIKKNLIEIFSHWLENLHK